MNESTVSSTQAGSRSRQPMVMLTLATLGFAVNFWAWALLSPLGPRYKELLGLSGSQQALIVAVPVIVGALGRILVGALTDRLGGRVMFPLVSLATVVPVLFIGLAGVLARVLQRLLAITTAIWHNDHTGQAVRRSLLAYDH